MSVLTMTIEEICHSMPKVELHAHLNGSVTDEMLYQLNGKFIPNSSIADQRPRSPCSEISVQNIRVRSLSECWKSFAKIHEAIRTPEALYMVTCQVIKDFAQDQVVYLELRTTPKKIHEIKSKETYIKTVVKAILESKAVLPQILVKLLISIDRKYGEEDARENVLLTRKWLAKYPDVIVGLDVSGDPRLGSYEWIIPVLQSARHQGISISCHLSEVVNIEETKKFLEFQPERVSHGQFLHPTNKGTDELWQLAKKSKVPIEVCITSNLISGVSPSTKDHYVKFLYEDGMPFAISTDDSGVFNTTISDEFKRLLQIVPMSAAELRMLCMDTVSYSFASEVEKDVLTSQISNWWNENMSKLNSET